MDGLAPSRRQLLSSGLAVAAAATAGCLGQRDWTGGSEGTERELRLSLSREEGTLRESFVVDLEETEPDRDEDAFEAALAGESYTTQYRTPFLSSPEDPAYAERDGTYYRLGSVVVDEVTVEHPVLRLTEVDGTPTSSTAEPVAASSLPTSDQRAVQIAYFAARARGNEGGVPWGLVQRGGYVYRREEAVEASELLADDGPAYVTFRQATYAVEVSRETFHEPVYRATVEPVAETPERLESILRAKFVDARITREELSDAARKVLEGAQMDGYGEPHPYSDGYREVLRRLHKRAYLDGNVRKDAGVSRDGRQMLRYGDVYYDYRLRFVSGGGS